MERSEVIAERIVDLGRATGTAAVLAEAEKAKLQCALQGELIEEERKKFKIMAEEQRNQFKELLKGQNRLVWATWAIAIVTAVVGIATIYTMYKTAK